MKTGHYTGGNEECLPFVWEVISPVNNEGGLSAASIAAGEGEG